MNTRHRPSAVNGYGEVDGAWAFARNRCGPLLSRYGDRVWNVRLAPRLRRDRFTRAAGEGLRAACGVFVVFDPHAFRRLNPVRPQPATGGGCQAPPGSTVCHPVDSPASAPVRASTDPGHRRIRVLGRAQRYSLAATRRPSGPARSRPTARPGPGPRTPSPCDGTGGSISQVGGAPAIRRLIRAGR